MLGASEAARLNGCIVRRDTNALLVGGTGNAGVNGKVVDGSAGLVVTARRAVEVYSGLVLGGETLTVLTLGEVNRAGVFGDGGVDLNVSLSVLRARSGRTEERLGQLGWLRSSWRSTRVGLSVNQPPASHTPWTRQGVATGRSGR